MRAGLLALAFWVMGPLASPPPLLAAPAFPPGQQEWHYQVGWGIFQEVAQARVIIKPQKPEGVRVQFSIVLRGPWKLLNRYLPELYETEMVFRDGRWHPLVFREKVLIKGKMTLKEYRFYYPQDRLELWRQVEEGDLTRERVIPLTEPVHDPLTPLLNLKLGLIPLPPPGERLRVNLIPNPHPEEMVIRVGAETPQGRKVMITVLERPSSRERGLYFVQVDPGGSPARAWTRLPLGTVRGCLTEVRGTLNLESAGAVPVGTPEVGK